MTEPPAFVTYGWCRVSYVILKSLAERGVPVHVGDASRIAMCRVAKGAASFTRYRSPYKDPSQFVDDVVEAVARTGSRILIPGHEDALVIARHRDRFPERVAVPLADASLMARLTNKRTTVEMAEQAGVSVPATYVPASLDDLAAHAKTLRFPVIIKTQIGNSGKGVFRATNPRECTERYASLVRSFRLSNEHWPMIQEFVEGDGYGVCLLYNRGELRASFCERYIRSKDGAFGTSVFRESVDAPHLVEQAVTLMRGTDWHGVVHLDFIFDPKSSRSALIEVNPRFWGALDLAVRSGVDFPWLLYRLAVDGDVAPVTSYRTGVTSRWIVGEMMHVFNHLRRGRFARAWAAVRAILGTRPDGYDDYRAGEVVPLLTEMMYYGTRFLATGSTNPIEEGMIG